MGSKRKLLPELAKLFPRADNFYDLFGGGFSVSHYIAENFSYKFKEIYSNELNPMNVTLFKRGLNGEFNEENFDFKWISRDEFEANKDLDGYIRYIWSFGNNGRSYMYGRDIEESKRQIHQAVCHNDYTDWPYPEKIQGRSIKERYQNWRAICASGRIPSLERVLHLQNLESVFLMGGFVRVEQSANKLTLSAKSYDQIDIKKDSIVYCDIPYKGTAKYSTDGFDHDKFYKWALSQEECVIISEYAMPEDFITIKELNHRSTLAKGKNDFVLEKVFWNGKGIRPNF